MKFARYLDGDQPRVGIVDVGSQRLRPVDRSVPDVVHLIKGMAGDLSPPVGDERDIPLDGVELLAPIVPQRNIFCVGKNYREHAREFAGSGFEAGAVKGAEIDEYPAIFTKPPTTVVGPGAVVELHPHVTSAVDYEAELAVVIGKGGRDIRSADAFNHIWGYTIVNDVTARDRQRNHKQWFAGKALDTFCPMGPWVVTADEIDAENLEIECRVNGELRQKANTRDLIFDIPTLVAAISAGLTLQPGDVIATGTPAGVGIGFDPPRFLESGDEVTISVAGIGTLSNRFR